MNKRKMSMSYSSLRRQVRAQVDADMQFILDNAEDSDLGDLYLHSDSGIKHLSPAHDATNSSDDDSTHDGIAVDFESVVDMHSQASTPEVFSDFEFTDCHLVDSDSDTDEEAIDIETDSILGKLNNWAVEYAVSLLALGALLSILKPYFSYLPSDARTLLKTPRICDVKVLKGGGKYCHLGLAKGLCDLFQNGLVVESKCLELQFNVDGLPLFKSTNTCLWPILCMVKHCNCIEPFVVGVYQGNEKPTSASEFLAEFVAETSDLLKNGVTCGEELYDVKIHSFVCDAPARAFLKGIKCHSGYSSCEKCTEPGEYVGKVIFPSVNAPLRTDVSFDEMTDEDHHTGPCPLKPLSVGCVSQFGLDYMHLVCLGVVRRLLLYWKGPVGPLCVRLGGKAVSHLSHKLLALSSYFPCEFSRKPRSVAEVLRWKATELRQFLLYTGPVVLRDILSDTLYQHFMLLSVGVSILACPRFALSYCDYANTLLTLFVTEAEKLYGKEIYVYNVHCLIHLANDVKNLGILDNFSSFPFENKLGQLKKMIRKPQFALQQLFNRLSEKEQIKNKIHRHKGQLNEKMLLKIEHSNGPLLKEFHDYRQYRQLQTDKHIIKLSTGNNCIITTDGLPVLVKNILEKSGAVILLCERLKNVGDAFDYPLSSSTLGICKVAIEITDLFSICSYQIAQKCVLLPLDIQRSNFVVMPLLH